ncbi:unnamed protein product [Durusdinium trenchii]|uniref:Uncharacterized protein n=1 Tax=Durusdinium trenchii TaxID=1381693 RepID=A0ABP0QZX6_9DINO
MVQQDSRQGANGQLMSQLKLTREWRAIVKDPRKFIAKCVAQGIEVSWQKLNKVQRQTMKETNQAMKELPSARLIRHGSCGCAGSLFCKQLQNQSCCLGKGQVVQIMRVAYGLTVDFGSSTFLL